MRAVGCNGPIFLVFSPGVVGGGTVSTTAALVSVIYDASTRAVVARNIYYRLGAMPAAETGPSACRILVPPTGCPFE
jgi:hypothetical protein